MPPQQNTSKKGCKGAGRNKNKCAKYRANNRSEQKSVRNTLRQYKKFGSEGHLQLLIQMYEGKLIAKNPQAYRDAIIFSSLKNDLRKAGVIQKVV